MAFHDYPILGSVELTNASECAELIRLLYRTIHEDDGMRAACFHPRHGIRAERGDRVADWVICFECLSMDVKDGRGAHVDLGTNPSIEPRFTQTCFTRRRKYGRTSSSNHGFLRSQMLLRGLGCGRGT